MSAYVIDTNVLINANDPFSTANLFLFEVNKSADIVCLDDKSLILKEYFRNVNRSGQPGLGDYFAKWLFDNQYSQTDRIETVSITPIIQENNLPSFEEFPNDDSDLQNFDRSDRKFVAVALKSTNHPFIVRSADPDWLDAEKFLNNYNVFIKNIA